MKLETAIRKTFNKINKDFPLLRKGLRAYFVELIILTYQNFQVDEGYDDMNDSEKLDYSYEVNTCDEYHSIICDYDNSEIRNLHNQYFDYWDNMYVYFKLKKINRLDILKEF